ncbi:COG2426 family protein [Thermogladius sp. 4427co]|uniref:COG2426 family protein n=1 Tax=Thermogladius sp. 4427co TaxID=3450718 RepID=UPI003F7AD10A
MASDIAGLIYVFIVAFMPVTEVRGAIPLAYILFGSRTDMYIIALAVALAGNMVIAPVVIYVLRLIEKTVINKGRAGILSKIYTRVVDYAKSRLKGYEKLSFIGLAVFVAIPLPGTGAWTGSIIAHIIGMDARKAVLSVNLGVLGAFIIVLAVVELGIQALKTIFGIGY